MKIRRPFLSLALLIALFTGGALYYLNAVYLPTKFKAVLTRAIENEAGRRATVGRITYNPLRGIVIDELTIYEKGASADEIFIKVESVTLNPRLIPLIRNRLFAVSTLRLDRPFISLKRNKAGRWNFEDIIKKKGAPQEKTAPLRFIAYEAIINKGNLRISDSSVSGAFSKELHDLRYRMKLTGDGRLKFLLSFLIKNAQDEAAAGGSASIEGAYDLKAGVLKAHSSLYRIPLKEYSGYYKDSNRDISGGVADMESDIELVDEKLMIKSKLSLSALQFRLFDAVSSGSITISSDIAYNLKHKKPIEYKADITLKDLMVEGIRPFNKIDKINGNLHIANDIIRTEGLKGESFGCPLTLGGRMENFKDPYLEVNMKAELKNDKLINFVPDASRAMIRRMKFGGSSLVEAALKGKLKKGLELKGYADIADGYIESRILNKHISNLTGRFEFGDDSIRTDGLEFVYNKRGYSLRGSFAGREHPVIKTAIESDISKLDLSLALLEHDIEIKRAKGTCYNSAFDLKGKMRGYTNSVYELAGGVSLELEDLGRLYSKLKNGVEKLDLKGRVHSDLNIKGKLKDRKSWDVHISSKSPGISLKGFHIAAPVSAIYIKNGILDLEIGADAYGGRLEFAYKSDITKEPAVYAFKASVNGVDIKQLKGDTGLKGKDISGKLSLGLLVTGKWGISGSINGNGSIFIKNGRLFELPIVAGLHDIVGIPNFERAVFTDATGTFSIKNKKITTHDLTMHSKQVKLGWDGDLSFDRTLDFLIVAGISKEAMAAENPLGGLAGIILGGVSNFINVRLTGSLENPKYTPVVNPKGIFKNKIFEKFRGMFEGIGG